MTSNDLKNIFILLLVQFPLKIEVAWPYIRINYFGQSGNRKYRNYTTGTYRLIFWILHARISVDFKFHPKIPVLIGVMAISKIAWTAYSWVKRSLYYSWEYSWLLNLVTELKIGQNYATLWPTLMKFEHSIAIKKSTICDFFFFGILWSLSWHSEKCILASNFTFKENIPATNIKRWIDD